jgi:predicted Co/Zn/Cd cation transporter (cation efflux family)
MEKNIFIVSMFGTVLLASLGITFYFLLGSEVVLLDGLFTLIGIPTAILGLVVTKVSQENPSEEYPLGLRQTRPMLELFKSLLLLGLISLALINAVNTLLSGGSSLEGASIAFYGGAAMLACFLVAGVISAMGGAKPSSLVKLERFQWIQDGLLSGIIGVAFGIVAWIDLPAVRFIGPFLDQILVILLGVIFIPLYIKTIAVSGRQLLLSAPEPKIRKKITAVVSEALQARGKEDFEVTTLYVGGLVLAYIDLYVVEQLPTHLEAMSLETELEGSLAELEPETKVWLSYMPKPTDPEHAAPGQK